MPRFVLKLRLVISYIVFSRTSDAQLRTKVIKLLYPKQCLFEVYYASEARSYKEVSNLNFSTCELFFCHDMSIDQAEILVTSKLIVLCYTFLCLSTRYLSVQCDIPLMRWEDNILKVYKM